MSPTLLAEVRERFEKQCHREGPHLIWDGERHHGVWPRISVDGRYWSAAAVAWLLSGKALVLGARLWRTCDRERCISCRSTQAPPWSAKRRAAEQRRDSISRRSAPIDAPEPSMRWAAAGKDET